MSLDDEIDRLYQLPLSSFTAERDALAKRAGAEGNDVRRLQKPNAAAWAVNQVYWHRRKLFDRVVAASTRLREAHEKKLAGKQTDLETAEKVHRSVVETATEEARHFLEASGDGTAAATITAVGDTFQTLVWSPLDGRLIRPRKPTGLEAIAGLLSGPRPKTRTPAEVVPIRPTRPTPERKAEAAKREEAERRRRITEVDRELRSSRANEEKADAALERANAALTQATTEETRFAAALEKAAAVTRRRRDDVHQAREKVKAAAAERARLEAHRTSLDTD